MPSSSLPVTRASLRTRALQRADYVNSSFVDATSATNEVSDLVDVSLAKIHNMLACLYEDYFLAFFNFAIQNNVDTYPLPPGWMKLRQCFYVDSSGYRVPIRRLSVSDLTNVPISVSYAMAPIGYVQLGNNIVIFPKPTNNTGVQNSMLLFYIPQYQPVLSDNLPIEYPICFGWDEWVVNDVAYQIRLKSNEPGDDILRERETLGSRIHSEAQRRDAGQPPRVRDTGWGACNSTFERYGQFAIK